ncbi:hypothetical protein BaRGS_00008971 [Batillaria attramentaria]|uniref:P2X purinoreceptor 7 intracellular domain-containing protein n=1 Tax=Batillaria attramentaria TaxID=370345 RepID=A0ABD0LK36_9CAEN
MMLACKGNQTVAPLTLTNRQYRLAAYRQFVCWMLKGERLGKGKRIPIPSCVIERVRLEFPESDRSKYTGFKYASLEELF